MRFGRRSSGPARGRGRWFAPSVIALACALVGTACVRDESSLVKGTGHVTSKKLPPCPLGALAKAEKPVHIVLWHGYAGVTQIALQDMAKKFNASQHDVVVSVRNEGKSYQEVQAKYLAALSGGKLPDIVQLEDTMLRQMVDTQTLLPAESCLKAEGTTYPLLPAVKNYYTADGVFWPGFVNTSEPVLYFNAKQFKQAGLDVTRPPKTLAELETAAKALKQSGVGSPLALILNTWFVESWIVGDGQSVVNHDNGRTGRATKATFDNPATREVFTWLKRMQAEGLMTPFTATSGQVNQYLAVAQGKSAMTIETSTAATTIKLFVGGGTIPGQTSPKVDLSNLDPKTGPFPGLRKPAQVRVSGAPMFMTASSSPAKIAASWKFLRFMQGLDNQVQWHIVGSYLPSTKAVQEDPRVAKFWKDDLAGQMLKVADRQLVDIDPHSPGVQIGPYPQYSKAIQNAEDRLLLGGASVDDAIAGAQRGIQAALDQYNEDNPVTPKGN